MKKKRDIGETCRSSWKKNFKTTISQPKRLLQCLSNWDLVNKERKYLGACRFRLNDDKAVVVDMTFKGQNYSFTPEQITAMLFTNLKQNTEKKKPDKRLLMR